MATVYTIKLFGCNVVGSGVGTPAGSNVYPSSPGSGWPPGGCTTTFKGLGFTIGQRFFSGGAQQLQDTDAETFYAPDVSVCKNNPFAGRVIIGSGEDCFGHSALALPSEATFLTECSVGDAGFACSALAVTGAPQGGGKYGVCVSNVESSDPDTGTVSRLYALIVDTTDGTAKTVYWNSQALSAYGTTVHSTSYTPASGDVIGVKVSRTPGNDNHLEISGAAWRASDLNTPVFNVDDDGIDLGADVQATFLYGGVVSVGSTSSSFQVELRNVLTVENRWT